ncbi:UDPglucose--hexose-1-phosphate uridylyltransferase [Granulicatella balaenopterae]|uniref:Galactose-1-phosphate uridylyltransferase n=1 Tax=Granulicatella balaenopterae TaxID=137733 RepID=A0A1H9IZU1_9LACT|nr:UDP-glucose--hexose-1-phosphate uridylyltransferase [Granulicatella balaenopterae]SEQ80120.1 UDPglucose--hexose-1-phosphate uridylyltransferase [Granulicatella balaenopterae]
MIDAVIKSFVQQSILLELIDEEDRFYTTNQLLHLLDLVDYDASCEVLADQSLLDLLDRMLEYAQESRVISATIAEKDQIEAAIMNLVTPLPSVINRNFAKLYQENPQQATDYFYHLSRANNYIKTRECAKNIAFCYSGEYGDLEITINLSKPEKDPKEIAAAKKAKVTGYPPSVLAMSNEGYYGRSNFPARSNHRIIRLEINQEEWGFQYSPYAYFTEHSIFLSQELRPMKINQRSIENLLAIVQQLPHYFVGSNADLPIVGGSILAHDHYQAGRHIFPMEQAPIERDFDLGIPGVMSGIVKWPMSVIRLQSNNREAIVAAAMKIINQWRNYSDVEADILSHTSTIPHNTITPIARIKDQVWELDLVLRNNRTSEQYPDGIFHPHQDLHHIKKENIGLIEVMGLAILPPRLKTELAEVEKYLLQKSNKIDVTHLAWAKQIKASNPEITQSNVTEIIQHAIGEAFEQVLADAGVFKRTPVGQQQFQRFIASL